MRVSFLSASLFLASAAFAQQPYGITILPAFPSAMNDAGTMTMVGHFKDHVYTYTPGDQVLNDLGAPVAGWKAEAHGINNEGDVIATSTDPSSILNTKSFLYKNGAFVPLNPAHGGTATTVTGLNNAGTAVGTSDTDIAPNGRNRGVVWNGSNPTVLEPAPGDTDSGAKRINDSGTILGFTSGGSQYGHYALWQGGSPNATKVFGDGEYGVDLNNQGHVLIENDNGSASIWSAQQTINLGHVGGNGDVEPFDFNDQDDVVGETFADPWSPTSPYSFAFLYHDGKMIDLNSLLTPSQRQDFHLDIAESINNAGQIMAVASRGTLSNVQYFTLLLTPGAAPVPEPAGLLALAGGVGVAIRRKRKARAG